MFSASQMWWAVFILKELPAQRSHQSICLIQKGRRYTRCCETLWSALTARYSDYRSWTVPCHSGLVSRGFKYHLQLRSSDGVCGRRIGGAPAGRSFIRLNVNEVQRPAFSASSTHNNIMINHRTNYIINCVTDPDYLLVPSVDSYL
jgi:hypothetical protein